jgi:hypothetical protein
MRTLTIILCALLAVGCASSTPTPTVVPDQWQRIEKPEVNADGYQPHIRYDVCPHCDGCYPIAIEGLASVTLMACIEGCCNYVTIGYQCRTTWQYFTLTMNECDTVEWGTLK